MTECTTVGRGFHTLSNWIYLKFYYTEETGTKSYKMGAPALICVTLGVHDMRKLNLRDYFRRF